ncbi:MAG: hypothetical protein WB809_03415 [Thermoplasmata archaeon]
MRLRFLLVAGRPLYEPARGYRPKAKYAPAHRFPAKRELDRGSFTCQRRPVVEE